MKPSLFSKAAAVYSVAIGPEETGQSQIVTVRLTRPASTVEIVEPSITIERTILFPEINLNQLFDWEPTETKPAMTLRVGPEGPIETLNIQDVSGQAGRVHVDRDNCTDSQALCELTGLTAGQSVVLSYQLEGEFGLGTETRTIEISSDQLAASVKYAITGDTPYDAADRSSPTTGHLPGMDDPFRVGLATRRRRHPE